MCRLDRSEAPASSPASHGRSERRRGGRRSSHLNKLLGSACHLRLIRFCDAWECLFSSLVILPDRLNAVVKQPKAAACFGLDGWCKWLVRGVSSSEYTIKYLSCKTLSCYRYVLMTWQLRSLFPPKRLHHDLQSFYPPAAVNNSRASLHVLQLPVVESTQREYIYCICLLHLFYSYS